MVPTSIPGELSALIQNKTSTHTNNKNTSPSVAKRKPAAPTEHRKKALQRVNSLEQSKRFLPEQDLECLSNFTRSSIIVVKFWSNCAVKIKLFEPGCQFRMVSTLELQALRKG